jgi:hypothetical protein
MKTEKTEIVGLEHEQLCKRSNMWKRTAETETEQQKQQQKLEGRVSEQLCNENSSRNRD